MSLSPRSTRPTEIRPTEPTYVCSPWQNKSILDLTMGDGDRSPEWGLVHRLNAEQPTSPDNVTPKSLSPVRFPLAVSSRPRSATSESLEPQGTSHIALPTTVSFNRLENDTLMLNGRPTQTTDPDHRNQLPLLTPKMQPSEISEEPRSGSLLEYFSPLSLLLETFRNRFNLKERCDGPKSGSPIAEETVSSAPVVIRQHSNENLISIHSNTDFQPPFVITECANMFTSSVTKSQNPVANSGSRDHGNAADGDTTYSSVLSPSLMIQSVDRTCGSTVKDLSLPQFSDESISELPVSPSYSASSIEAVTDQHSSENCACSQPPCIDTGHSNQYFLCDSSSPGTVKQQTINAEHDHLTLPEELHSSPLVLRNQPNPAGRRYTYIKKSLSTISAHEESTGLMNEAHRYPHSSLVPPTGMGAISSVSSRCSSASQPILTSLNTGTASDSNSFPSSHDERVTVSSAIIDSSILNISWLRSLMYRDSKPSSSEQLVLCNQDSGLDDGAIASDRIQFPALSLPSTEDSDGSEQCTESTSTMLGPSPNNSKSSGLYQESHISMEPLRLQNSQLNRDITPNNIMVSVSPKHPSSASSDTKSHSGSVVDLSCNLEEQINLSRCLRPAVTMYTVFSMDQHIPGENKENISATTAPTYTPDEFHTFQSSVDNAAAYESFSKSNEPTGVDHILEGEHRTEASDISTIHKETASLRETHKLLRSTLHAYEKTLAEFNGEEYTRQTACMQNILHVARERDEAIDQANTMRKALDDMLRRNKRAVDTIATYKECQSRACIALHGYVDRFNKNSARYTQAECDYLDQLAKALTVRETQCDSNQRQLDKVHLMLKRHQCRTVYLNEQIKQQDQQREELQQLADRLFNGPSPLKM